MEGHVDIEQEEKIALIKLEAFNYLLPREFVSLGKC